MCAATASAIGAAIDAHWPGRIVKTARCAGATSRTTRRPSAPFRDGYAFYTRGTIFTWSAFASHAPSYLGTLLLAHGGNVLGLDGPFYGPLIPGLLSSG